MQTSTILKARLSVMNFLEFAVWGAYLISMGMYLGSHGLGDYVFWFYTVQGLVSIFMPAIIGIVADRWIPAQKTLSLCHLLAGGFMIAVGFVGKHGGANLDFGPIFILYTLSVAFFMPTIGLSNAVAFNGLDKWGLSTVKDFPPIRVMGTVGFICAEIAVNFISIDGREIQYTYNQFFFSGILSLIMAGYALTLPGCPIKKGGASKSLAEAMGLDAFKLFKHKDMAIFFVFSMLLGVSLQITNSYGSLFINHFESVPGFAGGFWANNPTLLISISQCAEAVCILLIPFCIKRYGIKGVMLIAMIGWVLRFGFFGIGNTGSGVTFLILSCIVYGVAFDFFNVSGGLYVDARVEPTQRSSGQGLFMLMTNGIGASIGTYLAGTFVVNKLVFNPDIASDPTAQLNGWHASWLIFATYSLIVAILFYFIFREKRTTGFGADDVKKAESETIILE